MVTIYDIAVKCGVSPSTVSKVINNYDAIPEETKNKVRKVMSDMNYIPNVAAKSLSKGKSRNVGILAYFGTNISPFKHTLFTEILDSFQTEINVKNYDLLFIAHNVGDQDGSFLKNCISRDVSGVLLFGDFGNPEMQEVIKSPIPKVAFDFMDAGMSGVYSDNYDQMKAMTNHLIRLGHKNIVFIHGEATTDITSMRIRGYCDAIKESGIEFKDEMLVGAKYTDVSWIKDLTKNLIHRPERPTAIMYPDDYSAIASIEPIHQAGLSVPKDISITGFDGLPITQLVTPTLTTVRQDTVSIGKLMAQKLIRLMENKDEPIELLEVKSVFVPGDSTGEAPKGKE